jgi:hypothetical protein
MEGDWLTDRPTWPGDSCETLWNEETATLNLNTSMRVTHYAETL